MKVVPIEIIYELDVAATRESGMPIPAAPPLEPDEGGASFTIPKTGVYMVGGFFEDDEPGPSREDTR